jgi:hypothetical protein
MRVLKKRQQLFSDVFSKWEEGGRPSQVTLENWLTDSRKLARELLREEG